MTHLLFGLIMVALGLWGVVAWWGLFGLVMRGVVPFFLLVFGLVAIIAGVRRSGKLAAKHDAADIFPHAAEPVADEVQASAANPN